MKDHQPVNILVVDDSRTHLKIVQVVLNPLKQTIITANSGEEAIECVKQEDFAVILLDVNLPGINGFQTAARIREIQRSQTTPIIFMTAMEASDVKLFQGYNQGAVDFLIKPIPPFILKSKVSVFIELYHQSHFITSQTTYIDQISENLQKQEIQIKEQSALLELIQEAIMICDLDHNVQFWNKGSSQLYGWRKNEILEKNWYQLLKAKSNESPEEIKKKLILNDIWDGEFLVTNKQNKSLITYHRWTLRTDQKGKPIGYFAISYDVTDKKREQLAIRRSLEKEQEKNLFQQQFVGDSFNEIKNSLNLISGTTQMIRLYKQKLNIEQLLNYIERIENYTKETQELLEDLLFVIKANAGENLLNLVPVNLYKLCENLVKSLKFGQGRNHFITFVMGDEIPQNTTSQSSPTIISSQSKDKALMYLDEKIIWKMLNTLLSNAIQYSKDKTHIELKLTYEEDQVIIRVQDQGIGIPIEDQAYIFEPFYRGKNTESISGLGIGLHLVQTYVRLHQGKIMMTSSAGQGTTFQIILPRNLNPN